MRNAQRKPGYNVQFGVEGEYITGVLVSSERSDQLTLIPLMEKIQGYGADYKDVTADAGYECEENYSWFEAEQKSCYIKPQNYERSKTKKFKSNMALRENMAYDAQKDEYTCQAGQKLRAKYVGKRKSKSGFESEITYYECDDCSACPHKKTCTRAKGNRQIHVSKKFIEQRAASLERITSEQGILLRMNRSIQSEGAFGVVKQNYGFRQFLLRGHKKVSTEVLVLAMAYNINKLNAERGLVPKAGKSCVKCGLCAEGCPAQAIGPAPFTADATKRISCMRFVRQCPEKARYVNGAMVFIAAMAMKKACWVRKENELIL